MFNPKNTDLKLSFIACELVAGSRICKGVAIFRKQSIFVERGGGHFEINYFHATPICVIFKSENVGMHHKPRPLFGALFKRV